MATAGAIESESIENLLAKVTNPLHNEPDPDALLEFCTLIDKEHDGPQNSLRLLSHKIQSPIEKESLMALSVLEEMVKKCGCRFLTEIGKFRFLNEMIKVVSPKYLGNRASVKVKQKIVELLYIWSMEIKNEPKIAEAYQMLKRQGVVIEDPVYILDTYQPLTLPLPPARAKNAIFEDEEKAQQLQKLLRSKNADDLQAANRLIKNMVKEADKKMELMAKRSTELETVHNNVSVLEDMLKHYRPGETSEEEKDLMKELYDSCERLRPKLFRLAGELDEKDEGLVDILQANDELTVVINTYKKVVGGVVSTNGTVSAKEASLLDLASPTQESHARNHPVDSSLLDDQLLALGLTEEPKLSAVPSTSKPGISSNSAKGGGAASLADLDKIFNSNQSSNSPLQSVISGVGVPASSVFLAGDSVDVPSLTPLPPLSQSQPSNPIISELSTPASRGLEELDELGRNLLKSSLPVTNTTVKFEFPANPQKVPLNQLMQQSKPQNKELLLPSTATDSMDILQPINQNSPATSPAHCILSLTDVFVPLETVRPSKQSPHTIHDKNGLNIVIHFAKDSPRPDVTVMVVSTMSKNASRVKNVSFQAAVPKSMKVKLQPPSATDLPGHNPILPPAAITQVMLLANPQKEIVRLKYKVSYSIDNSEFKDVGEVDNLLGSR